jgi:hypothetical protein
VKNRKTEGLFGFCYASLPDQPMWAEMAKQIQDLENFDSLQGNLTVPAFLNRPIVLTIAAGTILTILLGFFGHSSCLAIVSRLL